MFFSRHPPWNNKQLACVHDYLEQRISKATRDVVSHDIDLGELNCDYLTNGTYNITRQCWISKGIEYIDRLERAPTHEAQRDLLLLTAAAGRILLYDAITRSSEDITDEYRRFKDLSDEEVRALAPRPDEEDEDEGPFIAWQAANVERPLQEWVLMPDDAAARRGAYVFWDSARIREYHLLQTLVELPPLPQPSEEEVAEMRRSWDERSKLWRVGISGYWQQGDQAP